MSEEPLSATQRMVLDVLITRPNGAVLRDKSLVDAALSLSLRSPRLVSDIYEMPNGGHIARITGAGKEALFRPIGTNSQPARTTE